MANREGRTSFAVLGGRTVEATGDLVLIALVFGFDLAVAPLFTY